MAVDVSGIAGDVYGVVGAGISLGVLAGTTGMVMRSMERNIYGRPYRREEEEYRRPQPQPRTYKKRTTIKKSKSKKRKTTRTNRRDEHEERPRYGTFSPYGTSYRSPRLNIPRYW